MLMNIQRIKHRRFGRLSLVVTAALLVCGSVVDAQTERPVPEAIDDDEARAQLGPSPGPIQVQCPSQQILAGKDDTFSPTGVEIAAPSIVLQNLIGPPFASFDGTATNHRFVHTFRLPPCKCLVGAKLEFRAKALGGNAVNDALTLGFSTLPNFPRWTAHLGVTSPPPVLSALSTPAWGSNPLTRIFWLDLAALPIALPPGTISLLPAMQMNKYLDFYVQDDTAIDYIKLTATMCDCCQANGRAEICISKFYDKNRNGMQETNEPALPGWTFQANDQAGGNVVTSPPTTAKGGICFSVLAPATYTISEVSQPGWIQSFPVSPPNHVVTVNPGGPAINLLFGNWREKYPQKNPL
jgi:hypothetical protein